MSRRILFLGENWFGSCARACAYSLRRLGHDVQDVDAQRFFPPLRRRPLRLALRAAGRAIHHEYNNHVRDAVRLFQPDLLLAFKGTYLDRHTIAFAQEAGVVACNYYPDPSVFAYGRTIPDALPQYDYVFFTKRFVLNDVTQQMELRRARLVAHGYDPEVHQPWPLTAKDKDQFDHDVLVAATHTPYKERLLAELLRRNPALDLVVWGAGWTEHARNPLVRRRATGAPLLGATYARALQAARINLALTSGRLAGASQGDETTTRTFEIPACGGFMLHERSDELAELFTEGAECDAFDSVLELEAKLKLYLADRDKREAIAAAGYRRCVPAYSYDCRMAELMQHVDNP